MDFDSALNKVLSKLGFDYNLKPEQVEVLKSIVNNNNTVCVLPTGYGKTHCFMLPPLILDEVLD